MLWIRRFEVAKQILKTLEEHELEFMIEFTIEKELRKKLGRRDSILQKVEKAKKGILRKSPFRVKVTVLVGEAKIEVPAKYWEWAATKASR